MAATDLAARTPSRLRVNVQRMINRALPSWVYPGPVTSQGIYTQDSGFLPWCFDLNFWQEGHRGHITPECAAVEAGVSAYAQTAAMLPATHWRKQDNGGREAVTNSALSRIFLHPNSYQTRSDFILNQVRALFFRGNCYALAEMDERGQPRALHPMMPTVCQPYVDPETQDVFYSIAPTDLTPREGEGWPFDASRAVPARFVWHVKLHTPRSPLVGDTPLTAAAFAVNANEAINSQQARFFANMSRPSGTLNTDLVLTKKQVDELRGLWNEQSTGMNVGGVPILSAGLKWTPLSMSASDAQLIEFYKLSVADIARVLRIPLPLIGEPESTFANTEVLMQFWIASGLGFLLEHLELSLDAFFNLPANEYCEFETAALLRSNFKERIEGLVRGVQGGIYTPNEGRNAEGLASVPQGDEPRMQQQVVPLTYWDRKMKLDEANAEAGNAPTPDPPPAANDDTNPDDTNPDDPEAAATKWFDVLTRDARHGHE
jgi:HK97 family phage portal protein